MSASLMGNVLSAHPFSVAFFFTFLLHGKLNYCTYQPHPHAKVYLVEADLEDE